MNDLALARAVHVLAVTLWIGGVAFVTTVLTPVIRRSHPPAERLAAFLRMEGPFAWQARLSVAAAGLSGLWMLWRADLWWRFATLRSWWMHAMAGLWLIFAVMLFVLEPLFLHRRLHALAQAGDDGSAFARMERLHRVFLAMALVTMFAAAGGVHGLF